MPQPYPGQHWKHGWIPVTEAALRSKLKKGGPPRGKSPKITEAAAEAGAILRRMREQDAARRGRRSVTHTVDTRPASRGESPRTAPTPTPSTGSRRTTSRATGGEQGTSRQADDAIRRAAGRPRSLSFENAPPGGWGDEDIVPSRQQRIRVREPRPEAEIKRVGDRRYNVGKAGSSWVVEDKETGERWRYPTKMVAELEADRLEREKSPTTHDLGDGYTATKTRRGWQLSRNGTPMPGREYKTLDAARRSARGEPMADQLVHATGVERESARQLRARAAAQASGGQPSAERPAPRPAAERPAPQQRQAERPPARQPEAASRPAPTSTSRGGTSDGSGAPVDGRPSNKPIARNAWGVGSAHTNEIAYHDDGAIGSAIKNMGDDARMDVDGEPLANVLGRLATDAVAGRKTTQEMVDAVKRIRDRLPAGSAARRELDSAIRDMDAPTTPAPKVPDGVPAPLRELAQALHSVPTVRNDPGTELEPLLDILNRFAQGRTGGRRMLGEVRALANKRHESLEGKAEIDRLIQKALSDLEALARQDRTALYPPRR